MKLSTASYLIHLLPLSSWAFSVNSLDGNFPSSSRSSSDALYSSSSYPYRPIHDFKLYSSAEDQTRSSNTNLTNKNFSDVNLNRTYIEGLLQNLSASLDRWIITGSAGTKQQAYNIMRQIKRESVDEELFKQAIRMAERASVPMIDFKNEYQIRDNNIDGVDDENNANNSAIQRKVEAEKRKAWQDQRSSSVGNDPTAGGAKKNFPGNIAGTNVSARSPSWSSTGRSSTNLKPDERNAFQEDKNFNPQDIEDFAKSKKDLEEALSSKNKRSNAIGSKSPMNNVDESSHGGDELALAEAKSSEIVARAGSGSAFEGGTLGIGGLDEVLAQVKRRVWVPLAAPPSLLKELGINPVRGLLLYGKPGCGKTLLARSLGKILSPARPITVVSGPEIMDKFVGSSEANLRAIFDNPPEIYDTFRIGTKDNGATLEKVALHVIIFDEFDAMARTRGGRGGGDQGDAGVARDSVVNQMLAKMDGVDPLVVPTLVIGMTNRRSLIEPALLRPGRFEVQIEVPRPKTVAQRVSILNVHMKSMLDAGRLLVNDAPEGTVAFKRLQRLVGNDLPPTYHELLDYIAVKCEGMSGASLAGVARAAASRALERAVCDFAGHVGQDTNDNIQEGYSIADCLVTKADFESAIEDVLESSRGGDGGDDDEEQKKR
mmetsp:Transcript_12263/g.22979  ORF Transcript_12263/g.22979 Transcript_12263/m.22979 type:complete len:657 (+) Transcript_12263:124-2094(+)